MWFGVNIAKFLAESFNNKKMKNIILAVAAMVLMVSCKTKSAVNNPISTTTPITSNSAFFKKIKEQPNFQQLKIS